MTWRHAQGRAAEAAGRGAESALAELHAFYAAQGRASIRRRPHEIGQRWDAKARAQVVTRSASVGADFAGVLAGGRAVSVEAKTLADSAACGARLGGLPQIARDKPEQLRELREVARMGGVALFLVDVRSGPWVGRYILPVTDREEWAPVVAGLVPSIPLVGAGGEAWGVLRVEGADWLAVVEAAGMREFRVGWPHERISVTATQTEA